MIVCPISGHTPASGIPGYRCYDPIVIHVKMLEYDLTFVGCVLTTRYRGMPGHQDDCTCSQLRYGLSQRRAIVQPALCPIILLAVDNDLVTRELRSIVCVGELDDVL